MDILNRLPVRSLLRFKCVSTFWRTLISDPYFTMKHLNHAKNDQNSRKFLISQLCFETSIFSIYCCPLSSVQPVEDVRKLDCPLISEPLHGLIHCCYDGLAVIELWDDIADANILLLWNPSTGESIVLPYPELPPEEYSCFGLGYDSTSGDYKILKIDEEKDVGRKVPSEILALKSGGWRKIYKHPRLIRKIYKHPRGISNVLSAMNSLAFVHGAFHWIGISRKYTGVSFNISNEVYGEIPLPEQICMMDDINVGITVLEGMLCVYSSSKFARGGSFKLWVMKEYGARKSWNALFTIGDRGIYTPVPKFMFADGEVLFWCLHLQSCGNAFRTSTGPFELWPRGDTAQNGFAFTESLISPKLLI